jgi:hypothetical protein
MHVLLSKWAPVEERSTMTTIVYAGDNLRWPLPVESLSFEVSKCDFPHHYIKFNSFVFL